jgi:hypothetical protein
MRSNELARSLRSKSVAALSLILVSAVSFSQSADLSRQDAGIALQKLRAAVGRVLNVPAKPARPLSGSSAVTRAEIIDQLYDLYQMSRPAFRQTFAPLAVNDSAIDKGLPVGARTKARELVRLGLLAPIGPVITNSRPGLTPEQFGDALALFVARLSEFTHTASARWSPHLMRP